MKECNILVGSKHTQTPATYFQGVDCNFPGSIALAGARPTRHDTTRRNQENNGATQIIEIPSDHRVTMAR